MTEVKSAKEKTGHNIELMQLNPENSDHIRIAFQLDNLSLEAVSVDGTHDPMDLKRIKYWMEDREDNMMRVVVVDNEIAGYVYLLNDNQNPFPNQSEQYINRVNVLQEDEKIDITNIDQTLELSWWLDGLTDKQVTTAVEKTLKVWKTKYPDKKTLVTIVDAEQMKEAVQTSLPNADLRSLRNPKKLNIAEENDQDTRVIKHGLGFKYAGTYYYATKGVPQDFFYTKVI